MFPFSASRVPPQVSAVIRRVRGEVELRECIESFVGRLGGDVQLELMTEVLCNENALIRLREGVTGVGTTPEHSPECISDRFVGALRGLAGECLNERDNEDGDRCR
jgi:hypothetical protein